MEDVYRYEVAVLGDGLAALFAGYLLKKNRIRFVILDAAESGIDAERQFLADDLTEESKTDVQKLYKNLAARVGMDDTVLEEQESGNKRMTILLRAELEEELKLGGKVESYSRKDETYHILSGSRIYEVDRILVASDIMTSGFYAQAIADEKKLRMESYMKKLRIRAGKQNHRNLVYITYSKNWFYVRETLSQYTVEQGAAAVNPFMNYGYYLNDTVKRDEVVECCHQLIRSAEELWVFGPISESSLTDIVVAVMEGKKIRFFSIPDKASEIYELRMEEISFEREVHAGQIKKSDLLNFINSTAPKAMQFVQMSLFDV